MRLSHKTFCVAAVFCMFSTGRDNTENNHDALLRDETENYIITDRYVFISGRRPGIRTMAV